MTTRSRTTRVYSDLSPEDKEWYNADIRATNILLQGLPKDIYSLINHYTNAKDIWDNVKMLSEGSELTQEDCESQLYDDFEHFCQNKGETIHDYYVRFAKLINDMWNIKMTMSIMQLNSKFMNNMLPEWDRFVTTVKLNRGLSDSNYDQLYAYLKQYEAHANENKMMLDRFTQHIVDPLALMFDRIEVRGTMHGVEVQLVMGEHRTELGMLIQVKQGRLSATTAMENVVVLDEEQLLFITADDCDAFDSNVDEAPMAQTMFMANLSSVYPVYDKVGPSYDSDILSEVHDHDHYQDAVCEHHEEHEMPDDEQVELYERRTMFELTEREQKIDEQLRIVITDRNIKEETLKKELHSVKMQLASTINHNKSMVEEVTSLKKDFKQKENKYLEEFLDMKALKEKVEDKLYKQDQSLQTIHMLCKPKPYYNEQNKVAIGYKNPLCLTRAKQLQPALYNGYEIIKINHVPAIVHNTEDTLEIVEITRRKMNDKMKDPECVTNKECYLTEVIPFFKTLKEHFDGIQKALTKEIKEMKDVFEELEAEVDQNVVDRKYDEIERKILLIAHDNLISDCLSKEVFYVATNYELNVSRFTEMHDAHTIVEARCLELEAELSNLRDKIQNDNHNELVKWFSNLETKMKSVTKDHVKPTVLVPGKYAKDVESIPPRNRNNREVHLDYLRHLKESVETLCEIVEEAKVEQPLDRLIVFACRYTKHSQELLEYAIDTCSKDFNKQDKKHAPTPLISKKQVIFEEQCDTSNSNTYIHVGQLNTQKTNVPVPPSTGVNCFTNASGSQPRSNAKKNKISPAKGVNKKKVEEHPRINKSNLRTTNHVDSSSASKRNWDLLVTPKTVPHSTCQWNNTPYELVHDKKPDLTFFRVFGALCYPTNDSEDLGKLPTADIGIFVGYAPSRKGYRIHNKRTRRIMETIHVQFDELTEQMAPMQLSTGPAPSF
ncbi:retrovirus-related pol polyprotein from transposon TNT 1-94 [Tanacetum coccineum]|uniref:Retrovirus-related pol polyprotein from transposon TNT 1-94 n=1 Tax=Tanacetum coccineum TaxID=301880 RepID=A0ABQ5FV00_9ASTR